MGDGYKCAFQCIRLFVSCGSAAKDGGTALWHLCQAGGAAPEVTAPKWPAGACRGCGPAPLSCVLPEGISMFLQEVRSGDASFYSWSLVW